MKRNERPRYRVVTAIAPPFVMYNDNTDTFYGYCIDLLNDIQSLVGFDYDIRLVSDNNFGSRTNGSWNGAIHELMENNSDIAVGPIWITGDRATVIDFTIPFYKQTGFSIIMRKYEKHYPFFRFVMTLELKVWLGIAIAFFLTTFLLYAAERFSPLSYRNNPEKYREEPDDRFCSLWECFWYTFTLMTPQGGGQTPKHFSGKMLTVTWWLFTFIMVAVYMANLAAYETVERLRVDIESLEDLARQYQVQYSFVNNSATMRYFQAMTTVEKILYEYDLWKRVWKWASLSMNDNLSPEMRSAYTVWEYPLDDVFSKMYLSMMETTMPQNLEEALQMLKKVDDTPDFALVEESLMIRYLILTNCGFRQVGKDFGKRPSAFAVQRGSALKNVINEALTTLMIRRRHNELERKWWDENPLKAKCIPTKKINEGFGLESLSAVFLLIVAGIIISTLILCLQYYWYCYRTKSKRKNVRIFVENVKKH